MKKIIKYTVIILAILLASCENEMEIAIETTQDNCVSTISVCTSNPTTRLSYIDSDKLEVLWSGTKNGYLEKFDVLEFQDDYENVALQAWRLKSEINNSKIGTFIIHKDGVVSDIDLKYNHFAFYPLTNYFTNPWHAGSMGTMFPLDCRNQGGMLENLQNYHYMYAGNKDFVVESNRLSIHFNTVISALCLSQLRFDGISTNETVSSFTVIGKNLYTNGALDLVYEPEKVSFRMYDSDAIDIRNCRFIINEKGILEDKIYMAFLPGQIENIHIIANVNNALYEYVDNSGKSTEANTLYTMSNKVLKKRTIPSEVEFVDLGLGVKWANMNVGAITPTDIGSTFAYGDPTGVRQTDYGLPKFQSIFGTQYDIASINWNSNWQMPTSNQLLALRNKCDWEWVENNGGNGVSGYKVSNKSDATKYIFLPATKEYAYTLYWSGEYSQNSSSYVGMQFSSADIQSLHGYADTKCYVRPVYIGD